MVYTRLRGNPELRAQQHFDHCQTGIIVMIVCMAGIILPPVVFFFFIPNYLLVSDTPLYVREGVFVGIIAGLALIPAIVGYHM
ncbi:hypothetical protein, conserved [Eimeria maxima]|uniref:Uncharacterized protein n=1 Tax=Eimeria maxima TaxID=5804 RepID=U6M3S9_EIMMA|nr:hypothetical protein, conserved [Eimeria maxima]CDJ56355.1 hypothetical protein, conserved [Eimeria maxima]